MTITLRDYQAEAIQLVAKSHASGKQAPLLVLPTGGGKTTIFCHLAHQWANEGKTVWIIAHRRELIRQAAFSLCRVGLPHKILAPKATSNAIVKDEWLTFGRSWIDVSARVHVGSIQTVARQLDKFSPPDVIIIDEAHHVAGDNQYVQMLQHFPSARGLLVTATPKRRDGKGLGVGQGGMADDLLQVRTTADLIAEGYLCPYRVTGISPGAAPDLSTVKDRAGDFDLAALDKLLNRPTIIGDAVTTYRRRTEGKRAVAFCVSVDHARQVADAFNAAGIPATSVDGTLDAVDRDIRLARFAAGEYHVISSADLIGEGLDIPAIDAVLLLRPTKSLALFLQQVGRGLRPHAGKSELIIIDHVGAVWQHGLPDDIFDWTLDGVVRRRSGVSSGDDFSYHIRYCEKCCATFPAEGCGNCCPICSALLPVRKRKLHQKDGDLVDLSKEVIAAQRREARLNQASAKTAAELVAKTGMSRARAEKIIEARAKKQELKQAVIHALRSWELRYRQSPWTKFGITQKDIYSAKPKRLREIHDMIISA